MQKKQNIYQGFLLTDRDKYAFLDINYAITKLTDENKILLSQFLNDLTNSIAKKPNLVSNLVQNPYFAEPFVNALMETCDEALKIQLIESMTLIYPLSGDNKPLYIDDGLIECIHNFLSSDSNQIIESSISLVCVVASSEYGNDSLCSYGIYELLIDISLKNLNEQLTLRALEALKKIFSNKVYDSLILIDSLKSMKELINFESVQIVNLALECFIEMANQYPLLISHFYDYSFEPKLISFLENSELISSSLILIGQMCTCFFSKTTNFLQLGIFDILKNLINTEHCADAFYALSNLVESVPDKIINMFDQSFIENTINITMNSSFNAKKEASYFLANLILFSQNENVISIMMNENLLDLFIKMLNYNSFHFLIKIMHALIRFAHFAVETKQSDSLLEKFHSDEFISIINHLIEEEENKMIKESAINLKDITQNKK